MSKEIKLNKNIIFFDVETNGFQGSSVLSMSAIKVNYNSESSGEERNKWLSRKFRFVNVCDKSEL